MHTFFLQFQLFFSHWGLLAVFCVLLLENFGLPLPGELALLYAGYHVGSRIGLADLILIASAGCIAGESIGFWVGWHYHDLTHRWLARVHRRPSRLEAYFLRHGAATIIFARFVAGLRVLAGPLAGLGRMPVHIFLACNVLGAVAWAGTVSEVGRQLGAHWNRLVALAARADVLLLAAALLLAALAWRRLQHGERTP